jgi:hypothetical protein
VNGPRGRVWARWVSGEVLDLARSGPVAGSVTGVYGSTLHADLGGFVVALLPPGVPRMPNGVSVAAALAGEHAPAAGDPVVLTAEGLTAGPLAIAWDAERPPRWDARVPSWSGARRRGLRERGRAILDSALDGAEADLGGRAASGGAVSLELAAGALARAGGFARDDAEARAAVESLLAAVRSRDRRDAGRAGRRLAGRGPGLTPAGDDVLAATALTVTSAGASSASAEAGWGDWLAALAPPDLRGRTTSVSATLLELAVRGRGIGPARELLTPGPIYDRRLRRELAVLRAVGHTTGQAYAATIGAVALLLAPGGTSGGGTVTRTRRPDES